MSLLKAAPFVDMVVVIVVSFDAVVVMVMLPAPLLAVVVVASESGVIVVAEVAFPDSVVIVLSVVVALEAGDETPFNANLVVDMGVYGQNGYYTHGKRSIIPSIQPELNHTTIGALATTVDTYDFVIHPGDFAYADDWSYNDTNLLDEKNVYEAIIEVCCALLYGVLDE